MLENIQKSRVSFLLILLLLLIGCDKSTQPDKHPDKIAVYNGFGVWNESAVATKHCLEEAERTVDYITEGDVQQSLRGYGLIIFPGGDPLQMLSMLGYTGRQNLIDFIGSGGGFIGLGGGAYLAADSISFHGSTSLDSALALFQGYASGPISQIAASGYTLTQINLVDQWLNPTALPSLTTLYSGEFGGPHLVISMPTDHIVIATFNSAPELSAAVMFQYGYGRVVLSAVQPEFEENDDCDGSDFAAELLDPDSEWFWLQAMAEWALWERQN